MYILAPAQLYSYLARRMVSLSSRTNGVSSIAHSPVSTTSTYAHSAMAQTPTASSMAPDPMTEHVYEDKLLQLGFRKPVTPSNPLTRMSFKELFKTILDHAAECDLQECRLDTRTSSSLFSLSQLVDRSWYISIYL